MFRVGVASPRGLNFCQFLSLAAATVLAGTLLAILSAVGLGSFKANDTVSSLAPLYSFDTTNYISFANFTSGEPSGLAYRGSTGTLFTVLDSRTEGKVVEFTTGGKLLAVYEVNGREMEG